MTAIAKNDVVVTLYENLKKLPIEQLKQEKLAVVFPLFAFRRSPHEQSIADCNNM